MYQPNSTQQPPPHLPSLHLVGPYVLLWEQAGQVLEYDLQLALKSVQKV